MNDVLHTLKVVCPDCNSPMRLLAYNAVKFEKYDRTCRRCQAKWEITREACGAINIGLVDLLTWEQIKKGVGGNVAE